MTSRLHFARPKAVSIGRQWRRWVCASAIAPLALLGADPTMPGPLLLDAARVDQTIVVVGERGNIARTEDLGATWRHSTDTTSYTLCGVSFAEDGTGWAVGHGALILKSEDGGVSWRHQFTGPDIDSPFLDVLALSPSRVIAVGAFGAYFESEDGGESWEQRWILDEDMHLNRISQTDDSTLFLAGEFGTLLRSTDEGASWETLSVGGEGSLYGVISLADQTLLAFGLRGRVYRSDDQGTRWTRIATPSSGLLMAGIQLPDSGKIVLAGQARAWLVSDDHGRSFHSNGEDTPAIAEFLLGPDGGLFAVGEEGLQQFETP